MRKPKWVTVGGMKMRVGSAAYKWWKRNYNRLHGIIPKVPKRKPSVGKAALKLAATQLGYKEAPPGSNHNKYGVWYGVDRQPWCAIFVSWVLSHAGRPFKYAYVPAVVADARAKRSGLRTISFGLIPAALKAGKIVLACYDWPGESPGVADHIGIVEHVLSGSSFAAIEGNTGSSNNSNGGEVMRQVRYTSEVQTFVVVE